MRLSEATNTTLATAEEYTKISGTFIDGNHRGFEVENNSLVYKGPSAVCFHFSGASDVKSNKACEMTYALYKNSELVESAQTPHTFPAAARISTISITDIVELNQDDVLEIYAKSDTENTVISVLNLVIVAWG